MRPRRVGARRRHPNAYAIANAGAKGDKTLFATFDTFARICF